MRGGGLSSVPGEVGPPQCGQQWLFWQQRQRRKPTSGDVVNAFEAAPPPPAAVAASLSHEFFNVIVDYPRGCNDDRRWCGGDIFLAHRCQLCRVLLHPSQR